MNYLIISKKKWEKKNFKNLKNNIYFSNKINYPLLNKVKPKIIFFIFWSKIIKANIYNKFLCIQFHSSNLPRFRGGSPIQNQIFRGIKKTKISAFKINEKIDTGDVCLKNNLLLNGSAKKIYIKIEKICISMIKKIIKMKKISFKKQKGKSSFFKRRNELQSDLTKLKVYNKIKIFDFIRMLDAPGYPSAYLNLNKFKILFNNAKIINNKINGKFTIIQKK